MKTRNDTCQAFCVDGETVKQVKEKMLPDGEAVRMAETFKVLGDRTRIKILYALLQKELCVCELSAVVGQSISAISHQLRVLRGARLVKYRKEGKNVYYSIDDEHIILLFEQMLDHVRHG